MNLWDAFCRCGHEMRRHRLDWEYDGPDPDCSQCQCEDFEFRKEPTMPDMVKKTVSLEKRPSDDAAADLSAAPADLVKRVDKARFALQRVGMADVNADVVMLIDHSGSMMSDYMSGLVQSLTDRALAFGLQLDADGVVPVIPFDHRLKPQINVTVANFNGVVAREIGMRDMGGTSMAAPFEAVRQMAERATKPIFLIVVGDGSPSDTEATTRVVCDLASYPVFIKFLAIRPVDYLQHLDDLPSGPQRRSWTGRRTGPERLLDNVDAKFIPNVSALSDLEFFELMVDEWSTWLAAATSAGLVS